MGGIFGGATIKQHPLPSQSVKSEVATNLLTTNIKRQQKKPVVSLPGDPQQTSLKKLNAMLVKDYYDNPMANQVIRVGKRK